MFLKSLIAALAIGIALPVQAGGPVLVEEEYAAPAETGRPGALVPIIIGALILCAIACGGSDAPDVVPGPVCKEGC